MGTFLILHYLLISFIAKPLTSLTVAVVEYEPLQDPNLTPQQRILGNTERHISIYESIESLKPDVIVFPESSFDYGRDNKDSYSCQIGVGDNPCTKNRNKTYPEFLIKLSCLARKNKITVIVNIIHKVFDKYDSRDVEILPDGTIDSRMSKVGRLGEPDLEYVTDQSTAAKRTYLDLEDLGIASMDHIFRIADDRSNLLDHPRNMFVVSSKWYSELPFMTSLQVLQMWAYEEDCTLFVSGTNNPKEGNGGTGIFKGKSGPVVMDILSQGGSRAYVYNFEKEDTLGKVLTSLPETNVDQVSKQMDNFHLFSDKNVKNYTTRVLDINQRQTQQTLCHKKIKKPFCCTFQTEIQIDSSEKKEKNYTYHFIAYSGQRTFFNNTFRRDAHICGIIACLDSSKSSCGKRFGNYDEISWPIIFKTIKITADFEDVSNQLQYPSSLLSSIRPITPSETEWKKFSKTVAEEENGETYMNQYVSREFSLTKSQDRLLTFAIYGRDFDLSVGEEAVLERSQTSKSSSQGTTPSIKISNRKSEDSKKESKDSEKSTSSGSLRVRPKNYFSLLWCSTIFAIFAS